MWFGVLRRTALECAHNIYTNEMTAVRMSPTSCRDLLANWLSSVRAASEKPGICQ